MSWLVYEVKNKSNGKTYVGITSRSLAARWRQHCKPSSKCLRMRSAIMCYGPEGFDVTELVRVESVEEAHVLERNHIEERGSDDLDRGYNLTRGGEGFCRRFCKHGHDTDICGRLEHGRGCKACTAERAIEPERRAKQNRQAAERRAKILADPVRAAELREKENERSKLWYQKQRAENPEGAKATAARRYQNNKDRGKAKRMADALLRTPEEKIAKSAVQKVKSREWRERVRVEDPERFEQLRLANKERCTAWYKKRREMLDASANVSYSNQDTNSVEKDE